jgi:preprotein translocase subunit SecG
MNPKLMRIFATLFLALPLLVSCATQAESNAADGKGDELERAIG